MPTFTLITITKNNPHGLKNTAASIRAQTIDDYEWIIIDGASTDHTPDYLTTITADWISEPDNGIYDAMNKGLEKANGDYILFLNADDELTNPITLETIKNFIATQTTPPHFIYGDAYEDQNFKPARSHKKIKYGMFTHHQAMIYNREKIKEIRFDNSYKIAADYDFTARTLKTATHTCRIPFPICTFKSGGTSQSKANTGRIENFKIQQKLKLLPLPIAAILFITNTFIWMFKKLFPKIYWALKSYPYSKKN